VRYEPFDVGQAYAFVGHQWVQCHSEHYAAFQGRSEKEVMLASKELLRRHQGQSARLKITARKLADLLQSLEADEVLLAQRMRDRESRAVRSGLALTMTNTEGRIGHRKDDGRPPPGKEGPHSHETYACKAVGLVDEAGEKTKIPHDLRRTGVRNLIRAGVSEKVAMRISGHRSRAIFDRYNITSDRDLQDAARKLASYIGEIEGRPNQDTGTLLGTLGGLEKTGGQQFKSKLLN
jgi:hypothetical protein